MEVEVVLREVGEHRGRDPHALGPPQLQRVRGDLHRAGAVAAVEHLAERALEVDRLGRRPDRRPLVARHHRGHGPEQAALAPGRLEQRADEERRGGLAVGARDPHYGQRGRGVPVEPRRGGRHRGAHVRHLHLGHAGPDRPRHHERRRSPRDRVGREVVPVARESGHAEEQGAGLHRAVVEGQAADLDRRPIAEQVSDGHPRAVYERPPTPTMTRVPVIDGPDGRRVLVDASGDPVGRYDYDERGGIAYADLFVREPGVTPGHAAAAVRQDLRGMRIAGDEALGRALVAAGGRATRHAHLMSHDLAARPDWSDPPGHRLTDVDRAAADLMDAYRAAYPPGHVDHRPDPQIDLEKDLAGVEFGPLLPGSGLAVGEDGAVAGAVLLGTLPGDPPLNGPWVIELFRHPGHRGVGRALLERALALVDGPALGLMVTEGNPARTLYEALGFRLVHTALVVQI
jgi:hypothetical protein